MITDETKELLRHLRAGDANIANASALENISAHEFLSEMARIYPITFQERHVGKKHEVGMARLLKIEIPVRRLPNSLFVPVFPRPVLSKCLFVSSYEDTISEITAAASIRVWPRGGTTKEVILKMGRGSKLDRTPDGWVLKSFGGRSVTLTETFLSKRGWRFDALLP
jgi:hypothetical protein